MSRMRSAFSFIELLVVIAVLGILAAISPLILPIDRFAVNQAVERFEADLRRARFEAVRTNQIVIFEVGDSTSRYQAQSASGNVLIDVDVGTGTALTMLPSAPLRLRIDPRGVSVFVGAGGGAIAPGVVVSVTISHTRGAVTVLEVNSYGRIRRV